MNYNNDESILDLLNIFFPDSEVVIELPSKYSEIFEYLNDADADYPDPYHLSKGKMLVDGEHFLDVRSFLYDFDICVRDIASPEMTKKIDWFTEQFKVSNPETLGDQIDSSAHCIYHDITH